MIKTAWQFITRVLTNVSEDFLTLIAAGVAFYILLGLFPAIGAVVSLYGLFADPHFIMEQIELLSRFLPKDALSIISDQAQSIVAANDGALGFGALIATVLAIYSATKAVSAIIQGLNIVYNETEKRNFIQLTLTGFALTFILIVYVITALVLVAGLPAFLNLLFVPQSLSDILLLSRWPLLFLTAVVGMEMLYYYGPSHERKNWRWYTWGSFVGSVLWITVSSFFSLFVTNFGDYNETYGSISAIIILLMWFWLSALALLFGAEINVSLEKPEAQNAKRKRRLPVVPPAEIPPEPVNN